MKLKYLFVGIGVLLISCAPTSTIGWQRKVAGRIKYANPSDIQIVRVTGYHQRQNTRDVLNSVEGIVATSPYGIGMDQSFSRNGTYKAIMVEYRFRNMSATRWMRFTKNGTPISAKIKR